jgi:hypothetical protein
MTPQSKGFSVFYDQYQVQGNQVFAMGIRIVFQVDACLYIQYHHAP